jgi:hypothetical protein
MIRANERDRFSLLLQHITGVAFFGCPHGGAGQVNWTAVFLKILHVVCAGTSTNAALVESLKGNSPTLFDISKSFVDRGNKLKIFSFYETEMMDYMNELVSCYSAALILKLICSRLWTSHPPC